MGNKNGIFGKFNYGFCNFVKTWGIGHHLVRYAGHAAYKEGYFPFRIYKGLKLLHYFLPIMHIYSNFSDLITIGVSSGGFNINN